MRIASPAAIRIIGALVFVLIISLLTPVILHRINNAITSAQNVSPADPNKPDDLDLWGFQVPQVITDSISPGETKRHEVNVEKAWGVIFQCVSDEYLRLEVIYPNGARLDSSGTMGDSISAYYVMPSEDGKFFASMMLGSNPPAGKWFVEIINEKGKRKTANYSVQVYSEGPEMNLRVYTDREQYQKNDTITIIAHFSRGQSPVLGATVTAIIRTVFSFYKPEDVNVDTLQLYDDGTHGDQKPADGKYSNIITNTSRGGDFLIGVTAETAGEPPVTHYAGTGAIVSKNRARFTGEFGDSGRDTDSDGLFDELVIKVGIDIIDANRYEIKGELRYSTPSGGKPAKGKEYAESLIDNASVDTFLPAGNHFVFLPFEGNRIADKHRDGSYVLNHIVVVALDSIDRDVVEYLDDAYTTGEYKFRDFKGESIIVIGNLTDRGLDVDGDGLFDSLIVAIEIDLKESDYYHWQGDLFGSLLEGVHLHYEGPLEAGRQTLVLAFPGTKIRHSAGDGPYKIIAPPMYGDRRMGGTRRASTLGKNFRTKAYRAEQFEK
jgi:hypothetical protein